MKTGDHSEREWNFSTDRNKVIRLMVENAMAVSYALDREGNFLISEGKGLAALGVEPGQVVGQNALELYQNDKEFVGLVKEALRGKHCQKIQVSSESGVNGQRLFYNHNLIPLFDDQGEVEIVIGVSTDITQRLDISKRLEESEEAFKKIVNSSTAGILFCKLDEHGNLAITMSNSMAEVILRKDIGSHLGESLHEVFPQLTTGDNLKNLLNVAIQGDRWDKDILSFKEGESLYFLEIHAFQTGPGTATLFITDNSERIEFQRKLSQNQKMEALGQLAGGMAHDFNNLLGGIIAASELITKNIQDNEMVEELNEMVISTSFRASDLIKKLLTFARETPTKLETVELNGVIQESLGMLRRTLDKRITIKENLSEASHFIQGDTSLIQSAIMNICINASHAMPEGGDLYISTKKVLLDENYCSSNQFALEPGVFADLTIEDTGSGIPKKVLDKIFDPFFTTKETGKGTGLGLAAIYGMVHQYKGEIKVYSEVGKGTSFHIILPISDNEIAGTASVSSKEYIHGSGTILVIDDEEIIRYTTQTMLEDIGYHVLTAENGRNGLEKAENPIDLVILDMNMPVMDGKTCFHKLKKINPDLPVIISSGFSRVREWDEFLHTKNVAFLEKPIRGYELSQLIHKLLCV